MTQTPTPRWAAVLDPAEEVTLRGAADLAYWREALRAAELTPEAGGGRAEVWLTATRGRFWGLRFCELALAVRVKPDEEGGRSAAYLAHAFNTSGLLAWCERKFFSTPYQRAAVTLATSPRAALALSVEGVVLLEAERTARNGAAPVPAAERDWEGILYLPAAAGGRCEQWFCARLGGPAEVHPFEADDLFSVGPAKTPGLAQALAESGFVPQEWLVRRRGVHARSRTFRRERESSAS